MQRVNIIQCFLAVAAVLSVIACKEAAKTSENNALDTASVPVNNDASSMPAYDPSMDPLTVGAQFSKLLHDTLGIKLYEAFLKPGDSSELHTHPDHIVYVLEGGKLAVYFQGVERVEMDLKKGLGFVSGPLSDAAKNIGNTTIRMLIADIYRPRGQ
jgi:hypothetical protein